MAMPTLNNWKDSLLLRVTKYAKLINKNLNKFAFNIITYTVKQVNGFFLHHIIFY